MTAMMALAALSVSSARPAGGSQASRRASATKSRSPW